MDVYLKMRLRLFLWRGVPFGIIMGVPDLITNGFLSGLLYGLVSGVVFGILMSIIVSSAHIKAVRRIAPEISEETIGVKHTRSITLPLRYDEAFDLCIKSLSTIKKCSIKKEDRAQGLIEAGTGITWKTWGDIISFRLRRKDKTVTQVEVSNRPAMCTTVVDYGRNLENVENIISFLRGHGGVA